MGYLTYLAGYLCQVNSYCRRQLLEVYAVDKDIRPEDAQDVASELYATELNAEKIKVLTSEGWKEF
jgi:hypothetical protein